MKTHSHVKHFILCLCIGFLYACGQQTAEPEGSSPAEDQTSASSELATIVEEHWADTLERNPVFATFVGVRDYDDRLGSLSVASMDAGLQAAQGFLERLEALDLAALTEEERLNAELLTLSLKNDIQAGQFHGRLMLITNRSGWHTSFARLPEQLPFFNAADYASYVSRLNDFPRLMDEGIATLERSVEVGYTQPCAPMRGYEASISAHIVESVDDSVFMTPFAGMPETMAEADKVALRDAAATAVKEKVIPAFQRFYDFYTQTYAPACRDASGVYGLDNAEAYYAHRARLFTTTTMTPDEIHELGLSEVARIIEEMNGVIKKTGFQGDRAAFVEFLRTDPQFYAETEEELLRYVAYLSKKADGGLPKLFTVLPRMPYTVLPVPADIAEKTTTAYYERPAGDGSRAGVYRMNLSKLDTRPLFEMEALTLHEAVPGHHFQIALAQELQGLPAFRRFGGMTAFVEGWGLYAERLGLEMGFYEDPYSDYGRLSYEMWRACRLVVDTGLHAKGWTRQQAIDFMAENTALSMHNIESEVDRYITWPGQALAYKIGELKIRELRARAEEKLGERFDVRRFHDTVLGSGAVPLTVLENIIGAWTKAEVEMAVVEH